MLEDWLAAYGRAWETRDPAAAAALFTDDAIYAEVPFGEPMRGCAAVEAYWAEATATQRDVRFGWEVIHPAEPAVARWWCAYVRTPGGTPRRLDGIFLLRFAADGRCSELREWWHVLEG